MLVVLYSVHENLGNCFFHKVVLFFLVCDFLGGLFRAFRELSGSSSLFSLDESGREIPVSDDWSPEDVDGRLLSIFA